MNPTEVAIQAVRQDEGEKLAAVMEAVAEAHKKGLIARPKLGHGERANDWQWAAMIARRQWTMDDADVMS